MLPSRYFHTTHAKVSITALASRHARLLAAGLNGRHACLATQCRSSAVTAFCRWVLALMRVSVLFLGSRGNLRCGLSIRILRFLGLVVYGHKETKSLKWKMFLFFIFFKEFIHPFPERGKGREKGRKRGRETSMCGCLSCASYWGPGPQPRHVPWVGMKPATFWFSGWHSLSHTSQGHKYDLFRKQSYEFYKV